MEDIIVFGILTFLKPRAYSVLLKVSRESASRSGLTAACQRTILSSVTEY